MGFFLKEIWQARSTGNNYDIPVANFGCVVAGRLYRGARFNPEVFPRVQVAFGMRSLVDLIKNEDTADKAGQSLACKQYGVRLYEFPMSDREAPSAATIGLWLTVMRDPTNWPVFVHCIAGVHRTGLLCAVYRVQEMGWSKEKAWREAEAFHFWAALGHGVLKDWFFNTYDPAAFAPSPVQPSKK